MSWIPGRKYFAGGVCNIKQDLTGQVVIVTGSSSGIGRETAKGLAAKNATVIMANRNQAKTEPIMEGIKKETGNPNVEFIQMDLEDLRSVREFVRNFQKKHKHLHILVNNAGINTMSPQREFTKDGFERNVGANYLGHYYLTRLLSNTLITSQPSRVINVLTKGATKQRLEWDNLMSEKKFDNFKALFQSKIASLMFATELQQRFQGSNVKVVNLHPGWVKTESWADMKAPFGTRVMINTLSFFLNYFGKDPQQGAQTSLYCALEDFNKLKQGAFYSDCEEFNFKPTEDLNEENRKKLWEMSEQWIKEKLGDDAFEINQNTTP